MKYFANDGFGWYCIACSDPLKSGVEASRLMKEGEAESKNPVLSESARAKWSDPSRTTLLCPLCDVSEDVSV